MDDNAKLRLMEHALPLLNELVGSHAAPVRRIIEARAGYTRDTPVLSEHEARCLYQKILLFEDAYLREMLAAIPETFSGASPTTLSKKPAALKNRWTHHPWKRNYKATPKR